MFMTPPSVTLIVALHLALHLRISRKIGAARSAEPARMYLKKNKRNQGGLLRPPCNIHQVLSAFIKPTQEELLPLRRKVHPDRRGSYRPCGQSGMSLL
jgi:hypothetical protein